MLLTLSSLYTILSLVLVVTSHPSRNAKRHTELAHMKNRDVISKRADFSGATATWYDVGLGACGKWNVASDYIVALNAGMYGGGYPGPQCFKMITITCNGKTATAQIMDECMGCKRNGGIDMSRGLFQHFADLGVGELSCSWNWGSGGGDGGGDDSPPPPPPPPKTHHTAKSTSTWEAPTSSYVVPTTTHTTTHSTKTTHSTTHTHTTTSSPIPIPTYSGPNNLQNILQVATSIGKIVLDVAS